MSFPKLSLGILLLRGLKWDGAWTGQLTFTDRVVFRDGRGYLSSSFPFSEFRRRNSRLPSLSSWLVVRRRFVRWNDEGSRWVRRSHIKSERSMRESEWDGGESRILVQLANRWGRNFVRDLRRCCTYMHHHTQPGTDSIVLRSLQTLFAISLSSFSSN